MPDKIDYGAKLIPLILFSGSFLAFVAKVCMSCAVLDFFISEIGADNLGFYYSGSAALTFVLSPILFYFAKRFSPVYFFMALHGFLLAMAATCLMTPDPNLRAKIAFIAIMGTAIILYFSMWSLASYLISPFESKRLFPWVSSMAQLGCFSGAILAAISGVFNLDFDFFLWLWVGIECFQLLQGFLLLVLLRIKAKSHAWKNSGRKKTAPKSADSEGLVATLKSHRLPRKLMGYSFLYAFLWYVSMSLVGTTFDESGFNLTSLYGMLDLASALAAIAAATLLYPRLLKRVGLGTMYVVASLVFSGLTFMYLGIPIFGVGIVLYVGYRLVDGGVYSIALANQLALYPSSERDQIRLLADILAQSAGFLLVGLLFLLPYELLVASCAIIVFVFVFFGFSSRRAFNADLLGFLCASEHQLKSNAVALFDRYHDEESLKAFLQIIRGEGKVDLRIEAVETLGKTNHPLGLPVILELIADDSCCLPLKIGALSYLDNTQVHELDPFQQFHLTQSLRDIQLGRSKYAKSLRGIALRVLMKHNPNEETLKLVYDALLSKDARIVANAIEGFGALDYPGVCTVLFPFLTRPEGRIRANTVIALWKYEPLRPELSAVIDEMLESDDAQIVASAVFAVGETRDTERIETLKKLLDSRSDEPKLLRGVSIALAKLSCPVATSRLVDMLLGDDDGQASSVAYLCLRLNPTILNEYIIKDIYAQGVGARKLAWRRFSECGGFCHEQLELLGGGGSDPHHFGLP